MDAIQEFKNAQRQSWSHFGPFAMFTTIPAGKLVSFAGVQAGKTVLDVGCGTGVVSITARREGARVCGLDLTPELLKEAAENSAIAQVRDIEWQEGDAEAMPFKDATFDFVLSQFGHIFAPRPDVVIKEMVRVLKPGGCLAFSTWPPELFTGRMFAMVAKYLPPLPAGISPPTQWGDPNIVRERIKTYVSDIQFDRGTMMFPALSASHPRAFAEHAAGPVLRLVQTLKDEPSKLAAFRKEYDDLVAQYMIGNMLRQDYLMTKAVKVRQ